MLSNCFTFEVHKETNSIMNDLYFKLILSTFDIAKANTTFAEITAEIDHITTNYIDSYEDLFACLLLRN